MKKILYIIGAIGLMVSSCTKEDNFDAPSDSVLRITSGIATRAVGTMWEKGDDIGVTMFEAGKTTAIDKANTQYAATQSGGGADQTFTTADFAVAAGETDLYYPASGNVDIVAYYPYLQDGDGKSYALNMATTQTDLMVAAKRNQAKSNSSLDLKFHHVMSQITVVMTAGDGLIADDIAEGNVTVKLVGAKTKATYNLTAFDPNAPYATTPIEGLETMSEITLPTSGLTATGFAIPQVLISGAALIFEVNVYGTFAMPITTAEFESGANHEYTVKISRTGVTLTGSNITPWAADTDGSDNNGAAEEVTFATTAEVGMYYYKDGKFSKDHRAATTANPIMGVIFSVNADGKSGKVVSLDEGTGFAWSTNSSECVTNANNETNGLANMKTIVGRVYGAKVPDGATVVTEGVNDFSQTSFPTFWWVHQKNPDGTTYDADQKGIWYLPSKNELIALYNVYYQYGKNAFNALFNAIGVEESVGFNNDSQYYSSTESNTYNAWNTYFYSGISNAGTKLSYGASSRTRAILAF